MRSYDERPGDYYPSPSNLPNLLSATDPLPTVARGSFTPPRPPAGYPDPTQPLSRLTLAHLRLPIELVQRCAAALANSARARGAPHTLRLWRTGNEQAVISLAREVTGVPPNAACESLFWEQQGDEVHVSVTFGPP